MADLHDDLTAKQHALLAALLTHDSITTAAQAVHVAERTAFRWLHEPAFQSAYREARRHVVEQALATMQRTTSEAVEALHRNLHDAPPNVQVSAARALLDFALRAVEIDALTERIDRIEAALDEAKPAPRHRMLA